MPKWKHINNIMFNKIIFLWLTGLSSIINFKIYTYKEKTRKNNEIN